MSNSSQPAATPAQFAGTFTLSADGQAVLEELTRKFAGQLWHPDEAERIRRIAWREVIEHIYSEIDKAEKGG